MGQNENDALFAAIAAGDLVRVRSTLDAGADPNAERSYDMAIEREFYRGSESTLMVATRAGHEPIVRLLLERKANPNLADSLTSRTPLVEASEKGQLTLVETLLEYGSNPSARDELDKQNCLTAAIRRGHADVAQRLIKANVFIEPSALELACYHGRIDLAQLCIDRGLDFHKTEAFRVAARAGQTETLKWLVERGIDVQKEGPRALWDAANAGKAEVVRLLLHWGVPGECRNDKGWTALHWAAYNGNTTTIRVLLEAGADVNAHDGSGKTPLDWAKTRGKKENVEVLEAALKG